jgi:hypothetical protein
MDNNIVIDGVSYTAFNVDGNTWMIKRWQNYTSLDDESDYTESLLSIDTKDPMIAVKAAIARGSWS